MNSVIVILVYTLRYHGYTYYSDAFLLTLSYALFCFLTKGSKFYGNELKKEKQVNQRIENMMQQKAQITSQQLRKAQLQVLI